jgi:hypothetical protein
MNNQTEQTTPRTRQPTATHRLAVKKETPMRTQSDAPAMAAFTDREEAGGDGAMNVSSWSSYFQA